MPRKAIIDPSAAAEPRRSARISSQPKSPVEKQPAKPKVTRKRTVDDVMNEETEAQEKPEADPKTDDQAPAQAEPQTENGESANKKVWYNPVLSSYFIESPLVQSKADEEIDELEDDDDDSGSGIPILKIGDSLPSIILKNEKEEDVNVKEIASDTGVVVFLVPKADTRELMHLLFHDISNLCSERAYRLLDDFYMICDVSPSIRSSDYVQSKLMSCPSRTQLTQFFSWLYPTGVWIQRYLLWVRRSGLQGLLPQCWYQWCTK